MNTAAKLLKEIENFCQRHGMSETAFGREVARDNHMVGRIRREKSLTTRRLDKIREYMRRRDAEAPSTCAPAVPTNIASHAGNS